MGIKLIDSLVKIIRPGEQFIDIDSEFSCKDYPMIIEGLRQHGLPTNHFFRDSNDTILDYWELDDKTIHVIIPKLKKGITTIYFCNEKHTTLSLKIKLIVYKVRKYLEQKKLNQENKTYG